MLFSGMGGELLSNAFCLSEHRGGIRRFVSRDIYKAVYAELAGKLKEVLCTPNVGLPALLGMHFEQRKVFERCGMEHNLWAMLLEDLAKSVAVTNAADN
ncbi:unannotated protein [freshwater metagenome]|uniref:Unannotated protein n=1 Tax=freshwater metagenome TaxID=449393 RepID=A0A6J6ZD07_9ZZZZ